MTAERDCLTHIERQVRKLLAKNESPENIHAYLVTVLNAAALEQCDDSDPEWWNRYNDIFELVPAPHWKQPTDETYYTR